MVSSRTTARSWRSASGARAHVRGRYAGALELDLPEPIRSVVERRHQAIVDAALPPARSAQPQCDGRQRTLRAND